MRYLSVVDNAYRATVEEQDDTAVWFTHAIRNAGADVALVLQGDAVNYAVTGQDAGGLRFGHRNVRVPPDLPGDLAAAMARGVAVFALEEDRAQRGLPEWRLLDGIEWIPRSALPALVARYDRVLRW